MNQPNVPASSEESFSIEMPSQINKLQMIQFELMKQARIDGLDVERMIADLLTNKELWEAAMMTPLTDWPLLHLRDLPRNKWNVDALYLIASGVDDESLESLATNWDTTSTIWISEEDVIELLRIGYDRIPRVLQCWW